jgi:peptide/nickel transport system substrate-binding protein
MAALMLAAPACSSGHSPSQGAANSLVIVTPYTVDTLDPISEGYWANEFGYGDLLMRPMPNGTVQPWLLQSLHQMSPTTWKMSLRRNVTFQDGNPLDAAALVADMDQQFKLNSSLSPVLPHASVSVLDRYDVALHTATPVSYVPNLLANELMFPIYDVAKYEANKHDLVGKGIYAGPYDVTKLTSSYMVEKPCAHYFGGRPPLSSVTVRFVPDPQARTLAVESGAADIALYVPTSASVQLAGQKNAYFVRARSDLPGGDRMILNMQQAPTNDAAVRKAMMLGIDYPVIVKDVLNGVGQAATGMYSSTVPYALADQHYDPAAANALLSRDGWVKSSSGIRTKNGNQLVVTLLVQPSESNFAEMSVALESELGQIGILVHVEEVPDYFAAAASGRPWNAILEVGGGSIDYSMDPVSPLQDWLGTGGAYNVGHVSNPQLASLIAALTRTTDVSARYALLEQVPRLAIEKEAYVIFVANEPKTAIVDARWRNLDPSPSNLWVSVDTRPSS